ncbi:MAG: GNAT family N-acetyltransferase [Crocinitomicaceae bacterium]|nr:GNAT family N-acetyltransferase [Crocinitomicaceae bacterium]
MPTNRPNKSYYKQSSSRLQYRSLTMDDVESWLPFFDTADHHRFLGQDITIEPVQRSRNWIQRQCQRKNENEYGQLAVLEKESGKFIGVGGIITRNIDGKDEYEVTYSLFSEVWGQGYGTELAHQFIKYANQNIDTKRVISIIHTENKASIRVAEKNGLERQKEMEFMGMPVYIYSLSLNKT